MRHELDIAPHHPFFNRIKRRITRCHWWWHTQSHAAFKRAMDVLISSAMLVTLSPLLVLVAFMIKINDRGPVLFWQNRVGLHGRVFRFPKFRSMRMGSDALHSALSAANQHGAQGVTFKMKKDPRVTAIGRFIRRTSIDELPQLWCVLKGDMSLVGPRPPLESEVLRYKLTDRYRLSVTPGLTCIWQISGRSEVPFPEQVNMDLDYIRSQSIKTDLKLILNTIPAVLRGHGAY